MSGTASVPNTFATQVGQVPASQLDANWNALTAYINPREVASGTLAARPVGVAGQWYFATDSGGGTLYFNSGGFWVQASLGLVSSESFVAPVTITDATAGGNTHPFLNFQKTGSSTFYTFWQKPANFTNSETLTTQNDTALGLSLHLVADPGGMRLILWNTTNALPNVPHTGIMPTAAFFGDLMFGDIVAIGSNPMTYFIRANKGLAETAVTQLFSAQKSAGVEPDGGAQIVYAPFKNGGGVVSDGFIQLVAYGGGSGGSANEIQFRQRSASNTVADTWAIGGDPNNPPLYPKRGDATLDLGTPGNRVRAGYFSSNLFVAGQQMPKGRIQFCDAGGILGTQTVFYGPWATNATETNVFVQHIMPFGGVLRNFFAKMTSAPGANQDFKYTVRVNGVSTTIVATMSGVATTASDITHSATVNRGDFVTLQVTASTTAAGSTGAAAIEIDPA